MVYANKSNLKGFNNNSTNNYKIFINEALTKRRSIIFSKTRQAVRNKCAKGCWTTDGKIFVKRNDDKRVLIRTQEDLDALLNRVEVTRDDNSVSDTDDAITRRNSYSDAVKCTPMREEREQAVS